jgi:lauroyl/myristoyl acyltransferase
MSERSLTDLSLAVENIQMFERLCRLPARVVLDFLEKANEWEMRHDLAGRLGATGELIRTPLASTPTLAEHGDRLAGECAEYLFRSNATMFALLAQLERGESGPLRVAWRGLENLPTDGRPAVVFAPHFGFLYAVPLALAVLGQRSAALGNEVARDVLCQIVPAVAPKLWKLIDYILVPSSTSARAALEALAAGTHLVIFPEVNMGATGNVRAATMPFLGREIWVPTAAARFARIAKADIVPVLVVPEGSREIAIEVREPVAAPASRDQDVEVSLNLFAWLERVVLDRPQLWLGWPMLDGAMSVAAR